MDAQGLGIVLDNCNGLSEPPVNGAVDHSYKEVRRWRR